MNIKICGKQSFSRPQIFYFLVSIILITAAIFAITRFKLASEEKTAEKAISQDINAEQIETKSIQGTSISGKVKTVVDGAIILSVAEGNKDFRVSIMPKTIFYTSLSSDADPNTIPKVVYLTIQDITPGSIINVVSDGIIGDKTEINAVEIVKLQ